MDAREQRGKVIAETCTIRQEGQLWRVPSQSGNGTYSVSLSRSFCTCPDHTETGMVCKHMHAVQITISRSVKEPDGTTTTTTVKVKKTTYKQNWPAYDAAQNNEKRHFQDLLTDLCATITEPERKNAKKGGRPPVPMKDAAFLSIFKVYVGMSSRRFICDMRDAHERGCLAAPVSHASVIKAMENEALTPILTDLITRSAAPLAEVETQFAVDSSGFCMARYHRWFDVKYGAERAEHEWVKVHIVTGCRTNCVTAAEIHDKNTNDCNVLPSLVNTSAKRFTLREVSADKAYAANPNFDAVAKNGGTLYASFRKNTTGGVGGLYQKMFHLFCANREDYLKHYHQRSNVESTFSAVKRKFGEAVRCKSDVAARNEVYAKLICQNICCLIGAMYELNLAPPTWTDERPATIPFLRQAR